MIKRLVSTVVGIAGAALLALSPTAAWAEKRVALVIGNSAYENVSKLPNPSRDANAIAQMFKKAGFDTVIMEHDVGNLTFKRAIRRFEDASADADIAVVFYAGHGIEIAGTNYLLPVDAKLASDRDAKDEAISLERLVDSVESFGKPKRLRLIILDACRDNPFIRTMKRQRQAALRSITAGLTAVEPTGTDTLIAYAAKGGSVAEDGEGDNSPFTTALLKSLTVPGLDIRLAFGRVRDDVMKLTNRKQEPFVYGSLGGGNISLVPAPAQPVEADVSKVKADYELVAQIGSKKAWEVFVGTYKSGFYADLAREQLAKLTTLAALEPTAPSPGRPSSDESRAWSRIEATNDAAALQKFIERYPNSPLALNAQNRLTILERGAREREEKARTEREAALKRAEDERRAKAAEVERQRTEREAALKRAEVERLAKAAEVERQRAEREAALKRAEDERRVKAAKSEREKAELQAALKLAEEERRAKQAEAEQRKAELQAAVKRAEDERRAKQAEAEREKAERHAALQRQDEAKSAQVEKANTPALIASAQKELSRIGCFSGKADGNYNDATKVALKRYFSQRGRPAAEVAITDDFVSDLDKQKSRVCPLVCQEGQTAVGETCVASKKPPSASKSKAARRDDAKDRRRDDAKDRRRDDAKDKKSKSAAKPQSKQPGARATSAILGVGF